jgi:hypothetical protein
MNSGLRRAADAFKGIGIPAGNSRIAAAGVKAGRRGRG